jgi:hypothetical protein
LPDDRELVGFVEPLYGFVESRRRAKVRQPERAARVLDALAEDIEGAAFGDFRGEPMQEAGLHVRAVLLLELLPFLRLGGVDEVQDRIRVEAEGAVVVLGAAFGVLPLPICETSRFSH